MSTRHRLQTQACAVMLLATLVACGGKGGGGSPTQPTKTLTGLTISPGTTAIKVSQGETFTATATYSDGTTQSATAAWASDNTAVLTIDANGRAQAIIPGLATITATYQTAPAKTLLIQVVPDYQGTWDGDYAVNTCEATGTFKDAEICIGSDGFPVGTLAPVTLTITQAGKQLTGTMSLGGISGPLTGSIEAGGTAIGTASLTVTAEGITLTSAVNPLRLRPEGERMTGNFRAETTAAGVPGSWVLGGDLRSVPRTSATVAPLGAERLDFPTLRDARDAFRRR